MCPIQKHEVKCLQCGKIFDAGRLPHYVIKYGKSQRYLEVECAEEYFNNHSDKKEISEFIDPENDMFCPFCKKKVVKKEGHRLPGGWYAHEECFLVEEQREKTPEEKLDLYIMTLYDVPFVPPAMKKLIEKYRTEYLYTYTGMLSSLKYWYEIKKTPFDNKKGIGIIPYIYQDAYDYYHAIWEANQRAKEEDAAIVKINQIEMTIGKPQKPHYLKKLFNSIDKDEITNGE